MKRRTSVNQLTAQPFFIPQKEISVEGYCGVTAFVGRRHGTRRYE